MYYKLVYGDIAEMNVDCIVNASNGIVCFKIMKVLA